MSDHTTEIQFQQGMKQLILNSFYHCKMLSRSSTFGKGHEKRMETMMMTVKETQ